MARGLQNHSPMRLLRRALLLVLLTVSAGAARGEPARWSRLSEPTRQAILLRREVHKLQRATPLRTAHPDVARRLSAELSQSLGRTVRVASQHIIQVEWGSPQHQALRAVLKNSVGIGIYPSKTWGHSKLRLGDLVTDAVPGGAAPFPATGTRARLVPADGMHGRYYEAVFAADPAALQSAVARAQELVAEKCQLGMGCASFASKLLRDHLQAADRTAAPARAYDGRLDALRRSESAAGPLWKKAAGATPALIVVYTPPGDFRSVASPGFKFDYSLR